MAFQSSIPGYSGAPSGPASLSPRPADGIHHITHHKTPDGGHVLVHHHHDGSVAVHHFGPHEHGKMVAHFSKHTV